MWRKEQISLDKEAGKKETGKKEENKKKLVIAGCSLAVVALLVGGFLLWQNSGKNDTTVAAREEVVTRGSIISSLTEEGTASVATQTTGLDLNVTLDDDTRLDLDVEVEEVLVRAGERVKAGDPLFVLSQTSLNKALNTLDNAYQEARLQADEAQINLKLGTAQAEQTRQESLNGGAVASGVYANTLTEMETKLAQYKKNMLEAEEDYAEYVELLDLYNVRTATKNNMKSLVDHYETTLESLQEFYDEYNEDNADYKAAYNNYKNQLDSLVEQLEKAEAEKEAYEDTDEADKYGDAYDTVVDKFDEAIDIINKYQNVIDEYDTLETRIEDAQEALEEAKEAYDEYNEDYQDWYGNMSRSDLERKASQMELDLENARLTYENYQLQYNNNINSAESKMSTTEISAETADLTYESTVNKLQQKVLSTQLTADNLYDYVQELNSCLQDNVILAPCDGLITNIGFEAGDEINLTQNVITIAQSDSISISLSIDQDDITNVSLDQQALVTFDTSDETFEGWVDAISVSPMAMGAPTVNYTVTVRVEGEGLENIYEGMSCTVELVSERVDDVLIIPKRAITTEGRQNYVTVKLEDGSTEQREVTLGFTDGSSYEVVSGLEEGDIVLIGSSINSSSGNSAGDAVMGGGSGNMPAGDMPEGMEMPSSGGMPSGAPSGGEGGMPSGAPGNS